MKETRPSAPAIRTLLWIRRLAILILIADLGLIAYSLTTGQADTHSIGGPCCSGIGVALTTVSMNRQLRQQHDAEER